MKKKCCNCGELKNINNFTERRSSSDGYNARCKICTRERTKDHYSRNQQYYVNKKKRLQQEASDHIRSIKKVVCCIKCGESHSACLEFHHTNPIRKEISIANIKKKCWSIERINQELKKCEVLCSNCHKKEHWKG